MKSVLVTQEEPFYISLLAGKIFADCKNIKAVIILPGLPQGFSRLSYIKRLYDVFGPKDSIAYAALFIRFRFLDFVRRWRRHGRFYSVGSAARRNSIPVYKLKNINAPQSLALIKALEPELVISVAAPQIFGKELIGVAKYTINIHAALLPQYRGMMPSFWVLAKGEKSTGVTVHFLDEHIDTGNIILQRDIQISPRDTLHSLQIKVAQKGAIALLEVIKMIESGKVVSMPMSHGGSYFSLPAKKEAREFRARGRRFI